MGKDGFLCCFYLWSKPYGLLNLWQHSLHLLFLIQCTIQSKSRINEISLDQTCFKDQNSTVLTNKTLKQSFCFWTNFSNLYNKVSIRLSYIYLLHIASQTAGPIGLNFFSGHSWAAGSVIGKKNRFLSQIFIFFRGRRRSFQLFHIYATWWCKPLTYNLRNLSLKNLDLRRDRLKI